MAFCFYMSLNLFLGDAFDYYVEVKLNFYLNPIPYILGKTYVLCASSIEFICITLCAFRI